MYTNIAPFSDSDTNNPWQAGNDITAITADWSYTYPKVKINYAIRAGVGFEEEVTFKASRDTFNSKTTMTIKMCSGAEEITTT